MVRRLRNQNKRKPNRIKRSIRYLKMVGRVIWLGALLMPPTDNGDFNGTVDNDNIVRQNNLFPSTPHNHKHRRGRMTTPTTTQVTNDKEMQPPAPHEDITTTMTWLQQQQRCDNNTDNKDANRRVVLPPTPPIAKGKIEKNSLPVESRTLSLIKIANSATEIIKENNHHYAYYRYHCRRAHAVPPSYIPTQK